jgi:hypothetical protein
MREYGLSWQEVMLMPLARATALFVQACLANGAEPAGPTYGERQRIASLNRRLAAGLAVALPDIRRRSARHG